MNLTTSSSLSTSSIRSNLSLEVQNMACSVRPKYEGEYALLWFKDTEGQEAKALALPKVITLNGHPLTSEDMVKYVPKDCGAFFNGKSDSFARLKNVKFFATSVWIETKGQKQDAQASDRGQAVPDNLWVALLEEYKLIVSKYARHQKREVVSGQGDGQRLDNISEAASPCTGATARANVSQAESCEKRLTSTPISGSPSVAKRCGQTRVENNIWRHVQGKVTCVQRSILFIEPDREELKGTAPYPVSNSSITFKSNLSFADLSKSGLRPKSNMIMNMSLTPKGKYFILNAWEPGAAPWSQLEDDLKSAQNKAQAEKSAPAVPAQAAGHQNNGLSHSNGKAIEEAVITTTCLEKALAEIRLSFNEKMSRTEWMDLLKKCYSEALREEVTASSVFAMTEDKKRIYTKIINHFNQLLVKVTNSRDASVQTDISQAEGNILFQTLYV